MHLLRSVLLLVVVSLSTSLVRAEGPMATDDAGTLDQGGMKVEGVLSRDDKMRAGEVVFGFGLIENVEAGFAFARGTDRAEDPSARLRGTGFGIKWVPIQNETGWSLGASFNYGRARVDDRTADERFAVKEYTFSGLASYRFGNSRVLHVNLGNMRTKENGESGSVDTWGIGCELPLAGSLQLTVEAFGAERSRPDKAIGLRYEVFEGFKVSAAMGRGNDRGFGQFGVAWEF